MLIIGMRSNGKTFSVKELIIDRIANGEKFIYIRREKQHITRAKMEILFDDIKHYAKEKIGSEIYYHAEKGFYILNEEMEQVVVGTALCVQKSFDYKGIPFTNVSTILFDEFMDYSYYNDEISKFIHLLSTITRDSVNKNTGCEVYLLANTIGKWNPYLDLYKFDMRKMKQGQFAIVTHQNGVNAILEYCKTKIQIEGVQPSNPYVGFDDNETVNMVLFGDWECKEFEVKEIDGIGWSVKNRTLVPAYVTFGKCVYELSLKTSGIPIAFCRKINTQNGIVNKRIKYNLSADNSLMLFNGNGCVPKLNKINDFIDEDTKIGIETVLKCAQCGRIIFDTMLTGTEFMQAVTNL